MDGTLTYVVVVSGTWPFCPSSSKFGSDFGVTSSGSFLCESYHTCINKIMKHHTSLHECNYICLTYAAKLVQISKFSLTAPFILRDHTENTYNSANIETA